jgi:hypothetical protein
MLKPIVRVIKESDFWFLDIRRNTYSHLAGHRCSAGNTVREALVWSIGGMTLKGENWSSGLTLFHCHGVRHKPHAMWPGTQPGLSQWEAGEWPPEAWQPNGGDAPAWVYDQSSKCLDSSVIALTEGLYMQQDCQLTVMTSCTRGLSKTTQKCKPTHFWYWAVQM